MTVLNKLCYSHFLQMELLEKQFYDDEYITPAIEAFNWYKKHPYSVVAIQHENKIIGFINMFPVSDSVFSSLKEGTFNDKNLSHNDIIDITESNNAPFHMFLSCIAVSTEYRNCGITDLLLKEAICQYAIKEELFDFILADAVTDDGNRFVRNYGFKFVCSSNHSSNVYMQSYKEFVQQCASRCTNSI